VKKKPQTPLPAGHISPRRTYYRGRKTILITFSVDDQYFKEVLKETAEVDERSVNSWMQKYMLPKLEEELDAQLQKMPPTKREKILTRAKRNLQDLPPPPPSIVTPPEDKHPLLLSHQPPEPPKKKVWEA
jgi:hypothetical protein